MRADGSCRRRVAADADAVGWSPDGTSLRYQTTRGVYEVPIAGGEPHRIAPAGSIERDRAREPGGNRVLEIEDGRLIVSRRDGSGRKILTDPYEDRGAVWSPEGARIAFFRGSEETGKWDVYVIGADGKGEHRISSGIYPQWLPDGRLLVERRNTFAIADPDPDHSRVAFAGRAGVISPDATAIAFVRGRTLQTGELPGKEGLVEVQSTLFVRPWPGTGGRLLARSAGTDEAPSVYDIPVWAPDGLSILIEEHDPFAGGSARIHQISVGEGEDRTVARDESSNLENITVSPDGERIAFSTDTGIDVVELDGGKRKTVVPVDSVDVTALKWSPDGRKLAHVVSEYESESVYDLYVVDADGSHRQLVSKRGDPVGSFDWRPAGFNQAAKG